MTPPRVLVTGRVAAVEGAERTGVNAAYVRATLAGGGVPVIASPLLPPETAATLLEGADALLLTGGADIAPARYGAAPHPTVTDVQPDRDALELALFAEARRRGLPVLAICRGLQLVNVALGGTLWQDLPSERPGPVDHRGAGLPRQARTHDVTVGEGTALAEALGCRALRTNSFHHQAIRDLATGLRVCATAADGVIEGVEGTAGAWCVGVQWHPEECVDAPDAPDLGLFRALTAAARGAHPARSRRIRSGV
ncbi:MAG TPA: gamma-glutamyl-gamma-aminobutyrate hydrolase family protein [Gemmatimonadales bacterium]|nr:gamma-glutamyl-gamma-aminobutyrate hydrolase family protein [Gemmatimonadales bacterium]